jgi:hypothetical protein
MSKLCSACESAVPTPPRRQCGGAIWLYLRFALSFRDVEHLLSERGIAVSYETVRRWVNHFGPTIAAHLRKRRPKPHATWHTHCPGRVAFSLADRIG